MLWKAFLDESETYDATNGGVRAYTVSCVLAPCRRWDDFDRAWAAAMDSCGAGGKIVHMRSLLHGPRGTEWEGWTEPERRRLFKELVRVIRSYPVVSYCGSIPMDAYEDLYAVTDEHDGRISPYQLVLQGTMEAIIDGATAVNGGAASEGHPVHFYMEENRVTEADLTHQFLHLTRMRGWTEIFPSFTPIAKGPAALQLADVVAYEGSTYASRHELGSSTRPPRKLYHELSRTPGFVFSTASRELLARHVMELVRTRQRLGEADQEQINACYEEARSEMQRQRCR